MEEFQENEKVLYFGADEQKEEVETSDLEKSEESENTSATQREIHQQIVHPQTECSCFNRVSFYFYSSRI